jgi:hypothetical protein
MPRIRIRSTAGSDPTLPDPTEPLTTQPAVEDDDSGWDLGDVVLGGGALIGAAALARRNPKNALSKLFGVANQARQQLMLSGLAVPKSILGNVGATAIESAERRSLEPLKQLFSRQTLRDIATNYKANVPYPGTKALPGPMPGRIMSAFDDATQSAMQRAGLTPKESARAVLQTPLPGKLGEAMDSPAAQWLIPFRRTPFNQFMEGLETLKGANIAKHPGVMATVGAAGAAHGAATEDTRYPVSLGLGTAAAGRYGIPYILAAIAGRKLAGGRTSAGLAGTILPVSEYGITSGIEDPLGAFAEPAAVKALRQLAGGR